MAPLARLAAPLGAARLLALLWTLLGAGALGWLLRRRAGWTWAAAGVALYLAAFDLTFWHMLVRVDGPMQALWLCAAAVLLPSGLERGADRLSLRRLSVGAALLLMAVLVKATAALHGAPLVLGWLLVDRRSALRLGAATALGGLAVLVVLQVATNGAFLWVNALWGLHPRDADLTRVIGLVFLARAWPFLALAAAAGVAAWATGSRPRREPALLLLLGGLTAVPLLGKQGAWWNYLLPLHAALVVLSVCWLAGAAARARPRPGRLAIRGAGPVLVGVAALALAATRSFPLPTHEDDATARAFYGFTRGIVRGAGGPVLVSCPDLLYFFVGQPTEIHGTGFAFLVDAGAPGTETVLDRLREGRYTLVVETWPISEAPEWRAALESGYRLVGGCLLGWYYGQAPSHIYLRRDLLAGFAAPPESRCAAAASPPPS
jgi:hypothetical protein